MFQKYLNSWSLLPVICFIFFTAPVVIVISSLFGDYSDNWSHLYNYVLGSYIKYLLGLSGFGFSCKSVKLPLIASLTNLFIKSLYCVATEAHLNPPSCFNDILATLFPEGDKKAVSAFNLF